MRQVHQKFFPELLIGFQYIYFVLALHGPPLHIFAHLFYGLLWQYIVVKKFFLLGGLRLVNEFVYDLYLSVDKALQRIVVQVVNDPERDREYKYGYVPHLVEEQAEQGVRRADDERGDERQPPWR